MFETMRNAWKTPELRKKLLYTLLIIVIFRLGCAIPVPFLDPNALSNIVQDGNIFGYLDMLSGGALSKGTVFALSIQPYINASIIVQLLTYALPPLENLQKEGEEGRKKIQKITGYVALAISLVMSYAYYLTMRKMGAVDYTSGFEGVFAAIVIMAVFTAGSNLIVFLGNLVNENGIGNGISIILFAGIVARCPSDVKDMVELAISDPNKYVFPVIFVLLIYVVMIGFIVLMNEAERRIPIQYAKRVVGRKMYGGQSTNIPIKVAAGGVMPIIFASSIMAFPATIVRLVSGGNMPTAGLGYYILGCLSAGYASAWWTSLVYAILYALLILFFTYFYSSIQFNPIELANNMKKSGGYIPGIRPGKPTSDYIGKISSRLNLVGAFFLAIIAILPVIVGAIFNVTALQIGGTSLLIMEGVALETVRQIESQMTMRHYKGFLE